MLPPAWASYSFRSSLNWGVVKFEGVNQSRLPVSSGVYAFLIQPNVGNDLNSSFLMYVGQTNSLRRRFGEYLVEARSATARSKLMRMFHKYERHLHFTYATVRSADCESAEEALLRALWPPINSNLPADIRAARRAF